MRPSRLTDADRFCAQFGADLEASPLARFLPVDPVLRRLTIEIVAEGQRYVANLEEDFEWRAKQIIEQATADAREWLNSRRRRGAATAVPLSPAAWLRFHVLRCVRPREGSSRRVVCTSSRGSPVRRSEGEPHQPDVTAPPSGGAA